VSDVHVFGVGRTRLKSPSVNC